MMPELLLKQDNSERDRRQAAATRRVAVAAPHGGVCDLDYKRDTVWVGKSPEI